MANNLVETSKMKDHWGYFKKDYDNNRLLTDFNVNREVDHSSVAMWMLGGIDFPDGSIKRFQFEPNDYRFYNGSEVSDTKVTDHYTSHSTNMDLFIGPSQGSFSSTSSFTINHFQDVGIDLSLFAEPHPDGKNYFPSKNNFSLVIKNSNNDVVYSLPSYEINAIQNNVTYSAAPALLAPGTYTITASSDNYYSNTATLGITLSYASQYFLSTTNNYKVGGGVRIKSISSKVSASNRYSKVENFFYRLTSDPTSSSGVLTHFPEYELDYAEYEAGNEDRFKVKYVPVTDFPGVAQGGNVFYKEVKVEYRTVDNLDDQHVGNDVSTLEGYDILTFSVPIPNPKIPAATPYIHPFTHATFSYLTDYSIKYSQGVKKERFNSSGKMVQRTTNIFKTVPNKVVMPAVKIASSVQSDNQNNRQNEFVLGVFRQTSGWRVISETIVEDFEGLPGALPIVHTNKFNYDLNNLLIKSHSSFNSDGAEMRTSYKYPLDYIYFTGQDPVVNGFSKMVEKNIITTPVETMLFRIDDNSTSLIDGYISTFKEFNTEQVLPFQNWKLKNNTPIVGRYKESEILADGSFSFDSRYGNTDTYESYDNFGNLLQSRSKGKVLVNRWGYNSTAVVANAEYTEVAGITLGARSVGYTGFETFNSHDNDNWNLGYAVQVADGHTGEYSCQIPANKPGPGQTFLPEDQFGRFILSAWVKTDVIASSGKADISITVADINGTNVALEVINKSAGYTSGKWILLEATADLGKIRSRLNLSQNIQLKLTCLISNSGQAPVKVDDIRFGPETATFETFTYKLGTGQTSYTNSNNISSFKEYDDLKKLKLLRNHLGFIETYYTNKAGHDRIEATVSSLPTIIQPNTPYNVEVAVKNCRNELQYKYYWYKRVLTHDFTYGMIPGQWQSIGSDETLSSLKNSITILESNPTATNSYIEIKCVVKDKYDNTLEIIKGPLYVKY